MKASVKLLSMLLVLAMCIGFVSVTAFADEPVKHRDSALFCIDVGNTERAAQYRKSRIYSHMNELSRARNHRYLRCMNANAENVRQYLLVIDNLRVYREPCLLIFRQDHHRHLHSPEAQACTQGDAHA